MAPGLKAETSVSYPAGISPAGIVFDGANIWVTGGSNTVTKLLASTGAIVGTYLVGLYPYGVAFDGANIWVVNTGDGTASEAAGYHPNAIMGTSPRGTEPRWRAFDGANIWVANPGRRRQSVDGAAQPPQELWRGHLLLVRLYPEGVAFDGANIWVAIIGKNTVTKPLASNEPAVGTYPAGSSPSMA